MKWPPWRRDVDPALTSDLPAGVLALTRRLPNPTTLRRRCQGLAMLEAVLAEEPEDRHFSFDAHWGAGQVLASGEDGSGDGWSVTFDPAGVWVRGFAHESPLSSWSEPHDLDRLADLPVGLGAAAAEPAFTGDDHAGRSLPLVTAACWWLHEHDDLADGRGWQPVRLRSVVPTGVDDGAGELFAELLGPAEDGTISYLAHAEHWHAVQLSRADVQSVLALRPLTDHLVRRLAPDRSLLDLAGDIEQIGYPQAH